MPKPKDLLGSSVLDVVLCVYIHIYKIRCKVNIVKLKCDILYMQISFVKYACMVLRKIGCDEIMLD